jgi:transposase
MPTKKQKSKPNCYNKLPRKVSQNEFNTFIKPCLTKAKSRQPKISYYKIFNYILYVLRTGMQWDELRPNRKEISWQAVYYHHNKWSKDGSYRRLFEHSVITLNALGKLDLSILHGDGSNVVAKKGDKKSPTMAGNTRKVKKCWP